MGFRIFLIFMISAFLTGPALSKEPPQAPDLEFLEFLGTFEETGPENLNPMDLADLPGNQKGSEKSPSMKSSEEKKKMEGKGSQR